MSFAEHVLSEIARLEAELEADPRFKMLTQLRAVAALAPRVYGPPVPQADIDDSDIRRGTVGRRQSPVRARALEIVERFLTRYSGPIPTSSLHAEVVRQGIELGGDNPQNNLSALLAHSKLFTSHGRRGWTLKREGDEQEVDDDDAEGDGELASERESQPGPPPPPPLN